VRHIREAGAMRGGLFPARIGEDEARALIAAEPQMSGRDLAREVSPTQAHTLGWGGDVKIAAIDTGIKGSIVRHLVARGAEITLHPCTVSAEELLATDAHAFFLANGPGDPAALDYIVANVRELIGKRPVWGICLGHQLLCRAVGLQTTKLPFGHRGGNHPVKDLRTGKIEITAQNHGFAVQAPDGGVRIEADEPVRWSTNFGEAALTHVNLYDRTVEGLELLDVNSATVQYHPEAGPGPNDALYQFDRFLNAVRGA
jgi:carbamoyl-phosphate synthase small subunit